MVLLDATALLLLLNDQTPPPRDPDTNELITDAHERMEALSIELSEQNEQILIASPVLAELLVKADAAGPGYVTEFRNSARFKMCAFDQKAAIEHAIYTRKALEEGDKNGGVPEPWAKVKFDRQIVALAVAEGVRIIYSDDKGLKAHAEQQGLTVITTAELKLNKQPNLFEAAAAAAKGKGDEIVEIPPPDSR
jgi:hypothetical protein